MYEHTICSAGNRWKISARLIIQIFDRLIDYNRLLLMLICPLNSVQYMADFFGQELKVHVYYNNRLLLCMAFMVSKAPL